MRILDGEAPPPRTGSSAGSLKLDRFPDELYHYTCRHAADRIGDRGELLPALELKVDHPLRDSEWRPIGEAVWLTDLTRPGGLSLGFDALLVDHGGAAVCDRMAVRYRVLDTFAMVAALRIRWWPAHARVSRFPRDLRDQLEGRVGARPAHWYVSTEPVPVELDEGWQG